MILTLHRSSNCNWRSSYSAGVAAGLSWSVHDHGEKKCTQSHTCEIKVTFGKLPNRRQSSACCGIAWMFSLIIVAQRSMMSNQKRWIAPCASIGHNSEPTARSSCSSLGIRFDSPTEQKLKESRMTMDDNPVFETGDSTEGPGLL